MKKFRTAIFALSMVAVMSMPAFAAELNQDSNPPSQDVQITLSISPTYIVSIPADTKIDFNETSTKMGTIQATHIQIEPNKKIVVSANAGALENKHDKSKTISYKLMNGANEFSSISLTDKRGKADLAIAITEDDWNKAPAGDYKGTVTFMISYENCDA